MAAKVRALVRKNKVMLPEPEIKHYTLAEINEMLGDPYEGQHSRYGRGKEQVDKLWKPEELALEIHESPQATMLNKFNIEVWQDASGKLHRAGGNRTQLATAGILLSRYGTEDVEVTIETETPEGRPVKMKHLKNYGVKFPVKFYGALSPDQVVELETRDNRAVKKASEADFFFKGWNILKTTNISTQPSKEKMLVRRVGVTDFNDQFPQRIGQKKDGSPYLPCVSLDAATGDITINGRENVQTFFRLFALPDEIVMAFLAGLSGEGPKITKRALVKLEEAWKTDKESAKGRLNNSMTAADIEKVFGTLPAKVVKDPATGLTQTVKPESSLLANFRTATAKKASGGKKIVPWSGGEMKKYEEGLLASTTSLPILMKIARREPGFARDEVVTALVEYVAAAERALGATAPQVQKLFSVIQGEQKSEDEEDEEESEDESEERGLENVDPETGEPLGDEEA